MVRNIGVSLVFEKQLHQGHILPLAGHMESGLAPAVLLVAAGAGQQQLPGISKLALKAGLVQGRCLHCNI